MGKDGITVLRIDIDGTRFGEWLGLTDDEEEAEATASDRDAGVETDDGEAASPVASEPAADADAVSTEGTESGATTAPTAPTADSETGPTEFDADDRAEGFEDEADDDGRSRVKLFALVGLAVLVSLVTTVVAFLLARRLGDDDDEFDGTEFEAAEVDEFAPEDDDDEGGLRSRLPVDRVPTIGDEPPNGDGPRDVRRPANELAPYVGVGALVAIAALARWSRGEKEGDGTQ